MQKSKNMSFHPSQLPGQTPSLPKPSRPESWGSFGTFCQEKSASRPESSPLSLSSSAA